MKGRRSDIEGEYVVQERLCKTMLLRGASTALLIGALAPAALAQGQVMPDGGLDDIVVTA